MYTVFLVDDDEIILDELVRIVPWMDNGFEVVGSESFKLTPNNIQEFKDILEDRKDIEVDITSATTNLNEIKADVENEVANLDENKNDESNEVKKEEKVEEDKKIRLLKNKKWAIPHIEDGPKKI